MAISKLQPMRPALDACIDAINDGIEIADGEVTTVKLADGAVTDTKLADAVRKGYVRTYDTVLQMQLDSELAAGMTCRTNGFNTSGDGGAAYYAVGTTGDIALQDGLYATEIYQYIQSYLNGKRVLVFGDSTSVFNANADGTTGKSVPVMLAEMFGCAITVRGVSGSQIVPVSYENNADSIKSIYWQVYESTDIADFDVILIFGGTNDIQNGNDFYASSSTNSILSVPDAVARIANKLRSDAPTATILYVTPFAYYTSPNNVRGTNIPAAVNRLKQLFSSENIGYIDAYNNGDVNVTNITANMRNSGSESDPIYVHPYELYRKRIARAIASTPVGLFGYEPQGKCMQSLLTVPSLTPQAISSHGNMIYPFWQFYKHTFAEGSEFEFTYPIEVNDKDVKFTICGYATTASTFRVYVRNDSDTNRVYVARYRGLYAGTTNFAMTIDTNLLEYLGFVASGFLRVGVEFVAASEVTGLCLLNGFFNGEQIDSANVGIMGNPTVYLCGTHIRHCGNLSFTTDASGALPSSFQFGISASRVNVPVGVQLSGGTRTIYIAAIGATATHLYDVSGNLVTNASGVMTIDYAFSAKPGA